MKYIEEIKLFATDCDGVLTDGGMYYYDDGTTGKKFNCRDGETFKENINTLIKDAKKYTNKIAFIGFIKAGENIREEYKSEKMIELDNTIKEICEKEDVTYIYMYDAVEKKDLTDGLHANSTGHQKMFERVFEVVKDM